MSDNAHVPCAVGVAEEVKKVLRFVVGLQVLFVVEAFIGFSGDERSLQRLPIFLLDHDLCSGVHLLMALIELLILVQDDAMFIGHWQDLLNALRHFLLVILAFF
jgi:hypothetical protein